MENEHTHNIQTNSNEMRSLIKKEKIKEEEDNDKITKKGVGEITVAKKVEKENVLKIVEKNLIYGKPSRKQSEITLYATKNLRIPQHIGKDFLLLVFLTPTKNL